MCFRTYPSSCCAHSSAVPVLWYRWEIESDYRALDRFVAATTSKDFELRFFSFAVACVTDAIR